MPKTVQKAYGRECRIRALLQTLQDQPEILPDKCIDMMYAIMINF